MRVSPVRMPPVRIVASVPIAVVPPRIVPASPAPIGAVPPAVIGPAVAPTAVPAAVDAGHIPRREAGGQSPRAEHRSDVFGFYPHFVAHDDDVVEGRIVGRQVVERSAVTEVPVARRHLVGGRFEAPQPSFVGAFVVVRHQIVEVVRAVVAVFGVVGLRLRHEGLPFGAACLRFGFFCLGLGLFALCDLRLIVDAVEVVARVSLRLVVRRGTACRQQCQQQ